MWKRKQPAAPPNPLSLINLPILIMPPQIIHLFLKSGEISQDIKGIGWLWSRCPVLLQPHHITTTGNGVSSAPRRRGRGWSRRATRYTPIR